jgi:DNA (cytosine-5)-methyltransferase 1
VPRFFEFFAGGGMVRLGLGSDWDCAFANDICEKKAAAYRAAFGAGELRVADVAVLTAADAPGTADLAWASFPCQDLSLAGSGAGLAGSRSGTFKPFWKLIRGLVAEGRAPRSIVLENVTGALSSHEGRDFTYLISALSGAGYRAGAVVIDAVRFLPQSRPRLFVIGARADAAIPDTCIASGPSESWHPLSLRTAHFRLPTRLRKQWIWWNLPPFSGGAPVFESILEPDSAVEWHFPWQTEHLISLMAPLHLEKLEHARRAGRRIAGTIYRRTRHGVQRAEARFDQVSGCLRTPAGGSSRQTVVVVEGERVRSRLLSAREAARLMGVPDSYPLPARYNDAYHLFGDGVAVPVAAWLSRRLLLPLVNGHFDRPASTPPVETEYLAAMHGRSQAGMEPGARTYSKNRLAT